MVYELDVSGTEGSCISIHFVLKLGTNFAMIGVGCLHVMSKGPSSLLHLATLPIALELFRMSASGAPLTIVIGCS